MKPQEVLVANEIQLRALADASIAIASAPGLDTALQVINERARLIIGAHQSITCMTKGLDWVQAISSISLSEKYAQWKDYDQLPDGSGIYSLVCRVNKTLRMTQEELESHPMWKGFGANATDHPPMRGWLAVPLKGKDGNNLGLILLSDKYEGEFTEIDESILTQFAQFASIMIEKTQAEQALRESETQLRLGEAKLTSVLNQLVEGVIITDALGKIIFVNESATQLHGVKRLDVTPENYSESYKLLTEDGEPYPSEQLPLARAVIKDETIVEERWKILRPDSTEILAIGSARPVYGPDGIKIGAVLTLRDETNRAQSENKIRESVERFGALADNISQLAWMADENGNVFWYNKRWIDFTRTTQEQMKISGWDLFLHPDYKDKISRKFKECIKEGKICEDAFPLKYRDESYRWFLSRAVPVKNEFGNILLWCATYTDITEIKKAEEALRQSEQQFRLMADTMPIVIWTARPDGGLDYYNQKWYEYTGLTYEQTKEWGWEKVMHPDDFQKCVEVWTESFTTGKNYQIEYRWKRASDQMYRWQLARALPIRDEKGEIVKWVGTGTDIHDQKMFYEELKSKNIQLTKINSDLDNFVYTASHDLKAPISNIEGLMNALCIDLLDKCKEEEKHIFDMIKQSIEKFKVTINDLTDITRVQKEIDNSVEMVSFSAILEESKSNINQMISQAKAEIKSDFKVDNIAFSKKNLSSIIYNLLSNSIKYRNPEHIPSIHFASYMKDNYIVLEVNDNGLGVDISKKDTIFKMFKRLHDHVDGSGVGLYIVKRIVDNAGGKIEVESEVGKGATFRIYFPAISMPMGNE